MNEIQRKSRQEKTAKRLRDLRPMDDEFMRCLFKDNIPLVQLVLRIITGKADRTAEILILES